MTGHAFSIITAADLMAWPRAKWRIKGVLPTAGLAAVYGPWGCGKSFLAMDMEAAIGEGADWFGNRTKQGRVVHLALEGADGVRQRVEAWERHRGRLWPDAVRFSFDPLRLQNPDSVSALAEAINASGGADAVFVDTLNRAAPEMDENSSRDMGMSLEGCEQLQSLVGGLVVLVAHSGKDASRGVRGHSSLPAALDAAIEVRSGPDGREWVIGKMKDGADDATHRFRLEVVELGHDEDGDPITSCVVMPDHSDTQSRPPLPAGGNQRIAYDALGPLLREFGQYGKPGVPTSRPAIELETAVTKIRDRMPVEASRRNERARDALKSLVARRVLGCQGGWIWHA